METVINLRNEQNPSSTLFVVWEFTKYNRTKSSKKKNHGYDETWTQNPLIPMEKHNCFGHTDLYGKNGQVSVYESGVLNLAITIGKVSTIKDLKKLELQIFLKNIRFIIVSRATQRKI